MSFTKYLFLTCFPEVACFILFFGSVFFTVFLERSTGITGVPFGRTELSIGRIGATVHALLHRHGPVGPSFQGMPEKVDFHVFSTMFFDVFFRNVNLV